MKQEHTALPWVAIGSHESEGFGCYWIEAQPSSMPRGFTKEVATVTGPQGGEQEANAAMIVRAVNSHHAMLEALEEVTDDLEAEIEAKRGSVLERTTERDLISVRKAHAAIRLAKGGV